jgi:tetratricopeptide (TPR) repeat protein
MHDIGASKEDYVAYYQVGEELINTGNFNLAKIYELKSIAIYPTITNYNDLGVIESDLGRYSLAMTAYKKCIRYNPYYALPYENIANISITYGPYNSGRNFDIAALKRLPHDSVLWEDLAILEDKRGNNADAKIAITSAATYGNIPAMIYSNIMGDKAFIVTDELGDNPVTIAIR